MGTSPCLTSGARGCTGATSPARGGAACSSTATSSRPWEGAGMEYRGVWALRGPNVWARATALEAELDLGGPEAASPDAVMACRDRLRGLLPGAEELPPGGDFAELIGQVALSLQ